MFEVVQAEAAIKLTVPKKMMAEADLEAWESRGTVSFKEVQQLTGRLSWIAGILPRTRWAVSIMYAVLGDAKRSENEERQRASKRVDQRPKVGLIAVKRLELPRRWFVTLFKEPEALTWPSGLTSMASSAWSLSTSQETGMWKRTGCHDLMNEGPSQRDF